MPSFAATITIQSDGPRAIFRAFGGLVGRVMTVAFLSIGVLLALDDAPLAQYNHTAWTGRGGFEIFPVRALAQTADGYLWIGSPKGLWRFDGARFVRWQPQGSKGEAGLPSEDIHCLQASRDGGLWIGTAAGLSKLLYGRMTTYLAPPDWLPDGVRALWESNVLWLGSRTVGSNALARISPAGEWAYSPMDLLSTARVNAILEDQAGSLWIGTSRGLCRRSAGKGTFFLTDPPTEVYSIAQDRDGHIFVACAASPGLLRFSDGGKFVPAVDNPVRARAMAFDRSNALWAGTFSQGLVRIQHGRIERYDTKNGLSSAAMETVLEDREGNIWFGTRTGLDRFHPTRVLYLTSAQGLPEDMITVVSASRQAGIWIGTATAGLRRADQKDPVPVNSGIAGNSILSIYEQPAGNLWLGTMNGLFASSQGRLKRVGGEAGEPLNRVTAITGDGKSRIWIADARSGIYSIAHSVAEPLRVPALLSSDSKDVYALMAGNDGRLWIGYYDGDIAVTNGTVATVYRAAARGFSGSILSLYQDTRGIVWAGTSRGLSRFRNGRWTEWTSAEGLRGGRIQGVIADDWNGLWLNAEKGLLRVPVTELEAQPDGSPSSLHSLLYGASEGVPLQGGATRSQPRITRAADGRIWFAREDGIAIVDPCTAIPTPVRPRVIVEELRADGRLLAAGPLDSKQLAFRGRQLEIEFTATSLSAAENLRFRYRLDGYDPGWIDAGLAHQARYMNLPPERYHFRVNASNTEGLWEDAEAAVEFAVLPKFYQTWYFRACCATTGVAILFVIYRIRVIQIERIYELRSDERLSERTRIARELHDTLLQSVVGISLQLDALSNRDGLSSNAIKSDLNRIRRQVDDSLREARNCVWALRSQHLESRGFLVALQEAIGGSVGGQQIDFSVVVEGKPYPYPIDTEEHLLRIAQEAVTNSVKHARCSAVRIRISYGKDEFCLQIIDRGVGLEPEFLSAGRPGHFGFSNMRERAERIGATFRVESGLQSGTTVELRLPLPKPQKSRRLLAAVGLH